jgi:hypothetical protein
MGIKMVADQDADEPGKQQVRIFLELLVEGLYRKRRTLATGWTPRAVKISAAFCALWHMFGDGALEHLPEP